MSTIEQVQTTNGIAWRVCVAGMCRDHQQHWQAAVFLHQMISCQPASNDAVLPLDLQPKTIDS